MSLKSDQAPTNKRKSVVPTRRARETEITPAPLETATTQPVFPGTSSMFLPVKVDLDDDNGSSGSCDRTNIEMSGANIHEGAGLRWKEEKMYNLSGNEGSPSVGLEDVCIQELGGSNRSRTESPDLTGAKNYMKTPQIDGLLVSRGEGRYEKLIRCDTCGKVCRTSNMARHKRRYCMGIPGLSPRFRGRHGLKGVSPADSVLATDENLGYDIVIDTASSEYTKIEDNEHNVVEEDTTTDNKRNNHRGNRVKQEPMENDDEHGQSSS